MRRRPPVATLDNVTIERKGDVAVISFNNGQHGGVNLQIGEHINFMTDEDIINLHNEILLSQKQLSTSWRPTEIAEGYPQIKFNRKHKTWSAEGDVLRCTVEESDRHLEPKICIDNHELSLHEFGVMISSFVGWGMRIEFCTDEELCNPPRPEVRKAPKRLSKKELAELEEKYSDRPAQRAAITIERVAREYLSDKHAQPKLSDKTRYDIIEAFMNCINCYGAEFLSKKEQALLNEFIESEDDDEFTAFCRLFGPEKILENVSAFVGDFLIRKMMLREYELETAALVVAEFCSWLAKQGFVPKVAAKKAEERARRAALDLPRAEKATRLIWAEAKKCPRQFDSFLELDFRTVKRVDSDSVLLECAGKEQLVVVPAELASLLAPNWIICCSLANSGKRWHFAREVGNVYPG